MPYSPVDSAAPTRQRDSKRIFPSVGDPAPDATLTDSSGNKTTLSSFWNQKTTILVFLRHFGCPFCREQVSRLKNGYAKIQAVDLQVVCIGQGSYKTGKAFSIYFDLPFPVLVSEEDSSVYGRYGLQKGTPKQLFGIEVILRGFSALKHGVGSVEGDPTLLPGVFAVDTNGTVLVARRAVNQADNVTVDELLKLTVQEKLNPIKEGI